MEWQPFETAPRDTEILIAFDDGRIRIAAWRRNRDPLYPFLLKDQDGLAIVRPWKDDKKSYLLDADTKST